MNYKKIAKFIKDARRLIIWNNGKNQWISDGVAIFPVLGMPMLSELEMLMFLGLYDKADSISVSSPILPEFMRELRYDIDDTMLEKTGPALLSCGEVCRTFFTERGALVFKNKYFDAVENKAGDDPITYFWNVNNSECVTVFLGFDPVAVILPIKVDERVVASYRQLADQLQIASANKEGDENESEG